MKPIHLWSVKTGGPNPWKVAMILEELNVPYETEFVEPAAMHTPLYEKFNPNGRVPAIHDPNSDLTLWESGAIITYLIENYDKEDKLKPASVKENYLAQQWLYYQVSGQGPYFGQWWWFSRLHPEKLPSAIERYRKEIFRVTKVLDTHLRDKEHLVGNKATYADLSFVMTYINLRAVPEVWSGLQEANPHWDAWMQKLLERPVAKKILDAKAKASQESPSRYRIYGNLLCGYLDAASLVEIVAIDPP